MKVGGGSSKGHGRCYDGNRSNEFSFFDLIVCSMMKTRSGISALASLKFDLQVRCRQSFTIHVSKLPDLVSC